MAGLLANPVILKLRTANLARACAFYTELFGWKAETVLAGSASYVALHLGDRLQGGVIEHESREPAWLPYVEVEDIAEATERALLLGAEAVVGRPGRARPAGEACSRYRPERR